MEGHMIILWVVARNSECSCMCSTSGGL